MTPSKRLSTHAAVTLLLLGIVAMGTLAKGESLCTLQSKAVPGQKVAATVNGVFRLGLERGTLENPECPAEATWIELNLKSDANKEKLRRLLDRSGQAQVTFRGEFYGPGLPDPALPEAIKKSYQPGWGHLGAFKTKLVVYRILDVRGSRQIVKR
jgi:hypothetical protein